MVMPQFEDHEFVKSSESEQRMPLRSRLCVEVAIRKDVIGVRNSNDPDKKTVIFTPEEWDAFVAGVKNNEFDIKR